MQPISCALAVGFIINTWGGRAALDGRRAVGRAVQSYSMRLAPILEAVALRLAVARRSIPADGIISERDVSGSSGTARTEQQLAGPR